MVEILGWVVGALFFGLWWGERGRRITAENWTLRGNPDGVPEAEVHTPTFDAETGSKREPGEKDAGFDRLTRRIMRQAGVSEEKAREEARELMGRA